ISAVLYHRALHGRCYRDALSANPPRAPIHWFDFKRPHVWH
ncbi:alpha/beta hydrolase family protein, partial [Vibrio parahaemolyticus EKP-028]